MAGIKLENCQNVILDGVKISGSAVGVEANNSNFTANNMQFHNVRSPFEIEGGSSRINQTVIRETASLHGSEKSTRTAESKLKKPRFLPNAVNAILFFLQAVTLFGMQNFMA